MFFRSPARGVIRSVAFPPRSGHPELVGSLPNGDGDSMDVSGFADPDELAPPKKPSGKRPRLVGSLVHENDDSMDVSVSMDDTGIAYGDPGGKRQKLTPRTEVQIEDDVFDYDGPGDARPVVCGAAAVDNDDSYTGELEQSICRSPSAIRTVRHSCDVCREQQRLEKNEYAYMMRTGDGLLATHVCPHCACTLFANEHLGYSCCSNGTMLDVLKKECPDFFHPVPLELDHLYFGNKKFQKQARAMNYSFNYSSIATTGTHGFSDKLLGGGPAMVQLHGTTYARLLSVNDTRRSNNPM